MSVIIKAVYIGNGEESFIESGFSSGINVVFSADNNVGKTIVMQGIMFALGATPSFPDSFQYREYIYIVDLDVDGETISVMRNRNAFAINRDGCIDTFDSVEAFQDYWSSNISPLPYLVKKDRRVIAGLELYSQMYFVIQDGRSSSRVVAGRYNKDDFVEMLYSIKGLDGRDLSDADVHDLKQERSTLREKRKVLLKQVNILRSNEIGLTILSATADRAELDEQIGRINAEKNVVADLRKHRNRLLRKLTKNEIVQKELGSLRIDVKSGELVCLECGSNHIGYRMAGSEFVFDVTTPEMREQILASVQHRIDACNAELNQIESDLRNAQRRLDLLFEEKPVTLEEVVASHEDYLDDREIDAQISKIDERLNRIEEQLKTNSQIEQEIKEERKEFMDELLSTMNYVHQQISENSAVDRYEGLFTTSSNVYSGSETTEYFLSRTYAIAQHIRHGMPIIVDSFRAEDLSTMREERVIQLFKKLGNQVIFTTTIKQEEGSSKYETSNDLMGIDYSGHTPYKLLSQKNNEVFSEKIEQFGMVAV